MGKTTEELNIKVTGDSARAKTALKATETAIGKVGKKTKATSRLLKNFKQNWIGITAVTAGAVIAVKKVVAAYAEQEKAQVTLAAAMKQAGTFTEDAFQENLKFASSLQKITTFGDEAILGVQKMLTNFGVEGEAMKGLTQATLDLAAAKGMDLKAAADLVAKSVGSSTNALTRYGIKVEGAAGSTERMEDAVKNISKIFGGAAKAEAESFAGSVTQLKNIFGDFMEKIGETIAKFLKPLIGILKVLTLALDAMPESMRILGIALVAAFTVGIVAAKLFGATLSVATGGISLLVGAVIAGTILMIQNWDNVKFAFEVAWAAIKIGLLEAGAFMLEYIPIIFKPWFIQIDLLIMAFNLFREEKLLTLTEMTADVQLAAETQSQIEKDNLALILEDHRAAAIKKKAIAEGGTKVVETEFQKQAKAAAEAAGKTKTVFNDSYTAITKAVGVLGTSFLDGVTTMKSSSKDVFASMARGFTALISGQLAGMAKLQAIKALASFPNLLAMGKHAAAAGAAIIAAGAVKAIGGSAVSKIMSAAQGADFVTSGPQMMLVGDNPSGAEHVQVTPSEQEQGGGGLTVIIQSLTVMANNVNEMADSIFDQAELAGARPFKRGGFA